MAREVKIYITLGCPPGSSPPSKTRQIDNTAKESGNGC